MKLILVDERHGHTKTIVLKGWRKGLLTIVLNVAPVALVYFGYQIAVSQNARIFTVETAQSWDRQIKIQAEQLEEIKEDLEREGLNFDPNIPIGGMIEVPAAAIAADLFAK